ncbi:MAG: hypothetical protein M1353_07765 [Nitrospirae bacterium]|nr:hypothetical protein [Nitrospirota bacterium]
MRNDLHIRLGTDLRKQLEAMRLKRKGITLNALCTSIITDYINGNDQSKRDALILKGIERLERRMISLDKKNEILAEMIAVYVRVFLTNVPPVEEGQRTLAISLGNTRFDAFIKQVSKKFNYGGSFFAQMLDQNFKADDFKIPEQEDLSDPTENTGDNGKLK